MVELIVTISWLVIAAAVAAMVYRLVTFLLIAFFGKNINIRYIDKGGKKKSKRININNDDELFSLLEQIKSKRKLSGH